MTSLTKESWHPSNASTTLIVSLQTIYVCYCWKYNEVNEQTLAFCTQWQVSMLPDELRSKRLLGADQKEWRESQWIHISSCGKVRLVIQFWGWSLSKFVNVVVACFGQQHGISIAFVCRIRHSSIALRESLEMFAILSRERIEPTKEKIYAHIARGRNIVKESTKEIQKLSDGVFLRWIDRWQMKPDQHQWSSYCVIGEIFYHTWQSILPQIHAQ